MNEYEIEVERMIIVLKEYMTNLSYKDFILNYQNLIKNNCNIRMLAEMYIFHKLFRENQINFYIN